MVTLITRHPVKDYSAWRRVLDEYQPIRAEAGVISETVYQSVDDPNDITLAMEFETEEAAKAFPANAKMQGSLEKAGTIGSPTLWYVTKV